MKVLCRLHRVVQEIATNRRRLHVLCVRLRKHLFYKGIAHSAAAFQRNTTETSVVENSLDTRIAQFEQGCIKLRMT